MVATVAVCIGAASAGRSGPCFSQQLTHDVSMQRSHFVERGTFTRILSAVLNATSRARLRSLAGSLLGWIACRLLRLTIWCDDWRSALEPAPRVPDARPHVLARIEQTSQPNLGDKAYAQFAFDHHVAIVTASIGSLRSACVLNQPEGRA